MKQKRNKLWNKTEADLEIKKETSYETKKEAGYRKQTKKETKQKIKLIKKFQEILTEK